MRPENIRNFSIIAHIDHGKSTLADRLLEKTHALSARQIREQTLDTMDLERERGITIKAHTVRLEYRASDGKHYVLNLIDTPGHVDFNYEVSRALTACEGTLLVVDAAQGVEAQTVANYYLARERNLAIIPVINKIDLPLADPEKVRKQLGELPGLNPADALCISARHGQGVDDVLEAIVRRIPAPSSEPQSRLKALIFDSTYDVHRGVVAFIRLFEGVIRPDMTALIFSSGRRLKVEEVGFLRLQRYPLQELRSGQVGYFIANVRNLSELQVGDTITQADHPASEPLPGYKEPHPMVRCGFYPADGEDSSDLRRALEKLHLNDPSFLFHPEASPVLGMGFRCGFLGLLHKEIIQERLEREFDLDLVATAPHVLYRVTRSDGETVEVDNPVDFPQERVDSVEEPYLKARIITPHEYLGGVFELLEQRRGTYLDMRWLDEARVLLEYKIPLAEMALKFYDHLKSASQGYASLDYEYIGYEPGDLVKVDIMVHGKPLEALSMVTHKDKAYARARVLVAHLKQTIPSHQFPVSVQAAIGKRVIARETIPALRKDVTAPLYGGDVTRKRKLLEKQKRGKKRLKQFGRITIPQEAFLAVMETE